MSFYTNILSESYQKKVDGIGLGIFRIFYFVIFLAEILQIFYYRHLIYDKIPYLETSEFNVTIPLLIWIFIVITIILGYRTRFFVIINYFFTVIFLSSMHSFLYHVFFIYTAINFLVLFIPISNRLSIDSVLYCIKNNDKNPTKVRQFHYFIIPFVSIGIVYLDSFFIKLTASSWQTGLGLWKPASLPMFTHQNLSYMLNQEYLMYGIGYFILLFEATLVFLFFRKKIRFVIMIIGILFHFGIMITFPIPWFGLTLISIYLLLMPINYWNRIFIFLKINQLGKKFKDIIKKYFFILNYSIFKISNQFSIHFWDKIIRFYVSFQIILLICSMTNILSKKAGNEQTFANKLAKKTYLLVQPTTSTFFGISSTGVFIDHYHYDNYEHIIAVTYYDKQRKKEIWLPIIDKNGMPKLYGICWRKFTSKVNNRNIKMKDLENGIRDFTAFWAFKNNINLNEATFNIKVKKIKQPQNWEKDFLENQISKPWTDGGKVEWKSKKIYYYIKDVENL